MVSNRLGITTHEATECIQLLKDRGVLSMNKKKYPLLIILVYYKVQTRNKELHLSLRGRQRNEKRVCK
jgi:hypothetical protein